MQKILLTALVAGFMAGLTVFAIQSFKLTPLISAAETYEEISTAQATEMSEHEHHHDAESWQPADGFERNAYRLLADIGMGIGFALMLVGAFSFNAENAKTIDAKSGILWGLAGFAVFSLAPSFGLPPELPTTMAAALGDRQIWWIATAIATATALALIIFGRSNLLKAAGVLLMVLPHLIGAPKAPLGGVVPTELNAQFAAASIATMAIFWVVLGAVSGWFYGKKSCKI